MKTYFIGLGGTGLRTVAELKKRLNSSNSDNAKEYAFTFVDTDKHTLNEINANSTIIPNVDFIDMGRTVPMAIYKEAKNEPHPDANQKRFLEWVISQEEQEHMSLPNYPLRDGATAQRNVGRTALYNCYVALNNELNDKIQLFTKQTPDADGKRDMDIWVVASSCGGTGSSMIIDVLYMINRLSQSVQAGEPNVKLVLFMPQTFVELNSANANHKLNAYACLEEINFFRYNFEHNQKQTFEDYTVVPRKEGEVPIDFPLYKYLIPVCSENDKNSRMSIKQLYPTIAEMIYYLNMEGGSNSINQDISNIVVNLKSDNGQTKSLVGYGFRAIKKPNSEFKDYLTRRALYEIVRFGLLDDTRPNNFNQIMMDFANNAILSKLVTLTSEKVEDNNVLYKYDIEVAGDSVIRQVSALANRKVSDNTSSNITVEDLRTALAKLQKLSEDSELKNIYDAVYATIKNEIKRLLNEFILDYGFKHAYDLIDTVDDYYLEPLCRYIKNTLLNNAVAKVRSTRTACEQYLSRNWLFVKKAEVCQNLKRYKDAVIQDIALSLAKDIIDALTMSPHGYLEELREGDNRSKTGIRKITQGLMTYVQTYKDNYAALAKDFRATANDAMTVYIPSLSEIAIGPNNTDWKRGNIFDVLYQGSVLEQQEIAIGLETISVPVRASQTRHGLKNILEDIDTNRTLFIDLIESNLIDISNNIEIKIIREISKQIEKRVSEPDTPAGTWLGRDLSSVINDRGLIPGTFKSPEALIDSFQDRSRVPVFFPIKPGVQLPQQITLLYVGESEKLAEETLGFRKGNNQRFVEDRDMKDRFLIMLMPAGFQFDMYRHYPSYKAFYSSEKYNREVRGKEWGCHIDQRFNERGLTTDGAHTIDERNIIKRAEDLVRCLFYQHIIDIFRERNKTAYNALFGSYTEDEVNMDGLTPAEMELLGLSDNKEKSKDDTLEQFIYFAYLPNKAVKLQLRQLSVDNNGNLEINEEVKQFDFNATQTQHCKTFLDLLSQLPQPLFDAADLIKQKLDPEVNSTLYNDFLNVKQDAKARLKSMKLNDTLTFGACLQVFKKNSDNQDKEYIAAIDKVIENL